MSEFQLQAGHNILLVRVGVEADTTPRELEESVIDWLGDMIGANPSRRSVEGEYIVGPANPVTVIPILGLSEAQFADRETNFCFGHAVQTFLGLLPSGAPAGALVHIDWTGAIVEGLPTRWSESRLSGWQPTTETPELAVVKVCTQAQRARDPIEPPGLLDDVLPELPGRIDARLEDLIGFVKVVAAATGIGLLAWFIGRRR